MGTRSTIALEYADGTVDQVYCHWDGYLSHNGAILLQHYADPFRVQELMGLGDLSSLCPELAPGNDAHSFSDPKEDVCVFYGRDRGETGIKARRFASFEDYKANHHYEEYEYCLRQVEGKAVWFVSQYSKDYQPLAAAMEQEAMVA